MLYEELRLGFQISFNNLQVSKRKKFGYLCLNFSKGSSYILSKINKKEFIKGPNIIISADKINKEGDIVGIILKAERTKSKEIKSLVYANSEMKLQTLHIHHPAHFGKSMVKLEVSKSNLLKIIAFKNVHSQGNNEFLTSINTEMVKGTYQHYMTEEIEKLKEMWRTDEESILRLAHKQECDSYGCVCNWDCNY